MQNLGTGFGERVRLVIGKLMKELGFSGFTGISGVDAVHVSPDHKFVRIDYACDERPRKIRAVPAKRSDAAITRRADESGDYRNDAVTEERKKNFAAATARFIHVRASVTKSIAGQDKF